MPGRDGPDRVLFARTLRRHREKCGLSREELAAEVHHSASTIANVETGYRAPTAEQVRDLDGFFDTPGTFADLEGRLHGRPFSAGLRDTIDRDGSTLTFNVKAWKRFTTSVSPTALAAGAALSWAVG